MKLELYIREGTNYSRKINIEIYLSSSDDELYNDEMENKYSLLEPHCDIIYQELEINFISLDLNIDYKILCQKTDYFSKIGEKLYIEFPELRLKNLLFSLNENEIDRSSLIAENNISCYAQISVTEK